MSLETDLFEAAKWQDIDRLSQLIEQGADVNAKTEYGFTVLMELVVVPIKGIEPDDMVEAARRLLRAGADPFAPNRHSNTAFSEAICCGLPRIVSLFKSQDTRLTDFVSLTEFLDPNWPRHGNREKKLNYGKVLEMILAEKPALEVYNERGHTPLIIACKEGNTIAIEQLLKAGADPNTQSKSGWTPLEVLCNFAWRARSECLPVIKALIDAGALPNHPGEPPDDKDYRPALNWTCCWGGNTVAVVKLLLEAGANPLTLDNNNMTALDCAKHSQRPDLVDTINEYLSIQHS